MRDRGPLLPMALLCVFAAVPAVAEKPNVVLVMADDLGYADTGFNGHETVRTPHLDRMAQNGLVFDRFYAAAPVCSPTRGSVLTGRHPYRYGVYYANKGHMRDGEHTIGELLQRRGYVTGIFGKWHLGVLTRTQQDSNRGPSEKHFAPPRRHGFDRSFVTEAKVPTYDPMLKPPDARRTWWDPIEDVSSAKPFGAVYWNESGERVQQNLRGDDSRVIVDRAVPFIRRAAEADKPFLAIVWFHTPHLPVVAGPEDTAPYRDLSDHARHYFGCVTAMDEQVGRLRETLRDVGEADNTLLAFCSDNGPEGDESFPGSAAPFRGRKRSVHEGGVRVPAIVEWPAKIDGGRRTDFPAVTSDYLPTVLDALNADYPDDRPVDGVSLMGVIEGERTERPKPIGFWSYKRRAWTDNRYKIYRGREDKAWRLYDLQNDPDESENLADEKPRVLERMKNEYAQWRKSVKVSDRGKDY